MTVRDHLGRSLAVGSALAVLGVGALTMTERALAVAPDAPAGVTSGTATAPPRTGLTTPIDPLRSDDPAVSTITVPVTAQPVIRDVDVTTFIEHSGSGDLDIELESPEGTVIKLIAGINGAGGSNDTFYGTMWDDSAERLASDLSNTGVSGFISPLVPEGSLGKLVGEDPRGVWILRVDDVRDEAGDPVIDGGTLRGWSLDISTQSAAPPVTSVLTPNGPGGVITDNDPVGITRQIGVSGQKGYLSDIDLRTDITGTSDVDDLEIRLRHAGREVVIATREDGDTGFFENNRVFDDSADIRITETDGTAGDLIPEGALAAFIGSDPNGVWEIEVKDLAAGGIGTLRGWSLAIDSVDRVPAPLVTNPPAPQPITPAFTTPPVVTPQALTLGLKRFGVVKNAKKSTLKLNVVWLNGTGRVNYTATLSTKLGKKTVRKVVKGSGVAGPKSVSKTVSIPKTWKGKKVTVRLVVKNNTTSLVRTKTIARF